MVLKTHAGSVRGRRKTARPTARSSELSKTGTEGAVSADLQTPRPLGQGTLMYIVVVSFRRNGFWPHLRPTSKLGGQEHDSTQGPHGTPSVVNRPSSTPRKAAGLTGVLSPPLEYRWAHPGNHPDSVTHHGPSDAMPVRNVVPYRRRLLQVTGGRTEPAPNPHVTPQARLRVPHEARAMRRGASPLHRPGPPYHANQSTRHKP